MGKPKRVKTVKTPPSGKHTKRIQDPEIYAKSVISWQFNIMDFDFEFGWNQIIYSIKLGDLKELELELLENNCEDELLFQSLEEVKHKQYATYADLLGIIEKKNSKISIDNLKIVMNHIKSDFFWSYIVPKLQGIETMKWGEFERQTHGRKNKSKNHWVEVPKLIKAAQQRLIDKNLDDYEELFSIRLSGKERIWGIREGNRFKLLWFDPNHKICPSLKD